MPNSKNESIVKRRIIYIKRQRTLYLTSQLSLRFPDPRNPKTPSQQPIASRQEGRIITQTQTELTLRPFPLSIQNYHLHSWIEVRKSKTKTKTKTKTQSAITANDHSSRM